MGTLAALHDLAPEQAFRADVCLAEAFGNIVSYAYADHSEHWVTIDAEIQRDTLSLRIEDDGRPFDPLQLPPRPQPTCLDDAPIGGLGIHLIRTMADEIGYERQGNHNHLLMTFRKRAAGSGQ